MSAKIIDGKAFAAHIREAVASEVKDIFNKTGKRPGLAVILVGNDPASEVYVKNKGIQAEAAGFLSETIRLDSNISQAELLSLIDQLNDRSDIHGILVQLPLPTHLDKDIVINAISPEKDVDGFHPLNVGKLWLGEDKFPIPCTPLGCSLILKEYVGSNLEGKIAVVIGASNIVGKPMGALLMKMRATVTICNSKTPNLPEVARQADILIVATGRAHLVKSDWIKPGAIVLDVGINRITDGDKSRLVGDVDFEAVKDKASAITPVPGGIGPMTIACLLRNTLDLMRWQENTNNE
ncbi:bifunctional methylenetetrahydrofolate dehydrogenase/methenyltetrahydrofolate cyclohydrolase FolD [Suttonella ornithocola]|uniref:Bifunctional protein FolD n=1 Tax=Suttonella ornithocola TaxID=279832 RepID=A0A380MWX5_9GAMM|nr:bifunctional methylenetetrahydrofolate dehydrogenase/methenyltetrahydrofolate cyclohydrolase FolD [Suttonella ornithocola]SUO97085.1 Bifunctional protein FolD [Suttonella ornithocola]